MAQQVQRIGGQLLQANLERELADLAFDTDLLVIKRDGTLGINTTTTPKTLTISGTLRSASGNSDPDIIFGNSLTIGDLTISTEGATAPTGDITVLSTDPAGYIVTNGLGSYTQAVRNGGVEALETNGGVGFRSTYRAGMTEAWNYDGNYGNYWYPGPRDSASAPENDCDLIYQRAIYLAQLGSWTQEEQDALDFDGDGDIQVDDALRILTLNTQWVNGQAFPASRTLADHANTEAFKAYVEKYYPRSAPRTLELQTGGTLNVTGNVHATGNITYGGTDLTVGDDSTDSARFLADFASNLVPDIDNFYFIGKDEDSTGPEKRFDLVVNTLETGKIRTKELTYQGIQLSKSAGNIFVSTDNGNDANRGTHPGGPFATIQKALSIAQPGDFIYVYPGQYQEDFPLVVPQGVTIRGDSIRSVEVYPTSATQSNDAFLLNGESSVEDLTIKGYYYNEIADTGYGFRYVDDYTSGNRSPYIRNITIITEGTTKTANDPRGFDSGDAGKGALVDASAVNENSPEASMLFHSVTFITPGVDALTMRNGVRVEWLNSFTYFANRGLYAQQGTQGRLLPDSTRKYGAEIRSIGSANVYGNIGAEADGADTLMYLINHNFAYIGTGKDATNDNNLVGSNQIVTQNSGQIYHTSQDHDGKFSVGSNFEIDQVEGNTSFDIESIFASNSVVKVLDQDGTEVFISADRITIDNMALYIDSIVSTNDNLNIKSQTDDVNILTDTNITGNLDVAGNLTTQGSITGIGNDNEEDTVDFNTPLSQDLLPGSTEGLYLGTSDLSWRTTFVNDAIINDIRITNGVISTESSSADLELRSQGDGSIYFENIKVKDSTIEAEFTPEGEWIVSETDEVTLNIFAGYPQYINLFPKHIMVFDIPVLGTASVSDDALKHTANLLAGFLDNNYDGVVDNATLYAEFSAGVKGLAVYFNNADEATIGNLGDFGDRLTSLYEYEMNSFQGNGVSNNLDGALSRILRYFIIKEGYTQAFNALGTTRPTDITTLMDTARGGYQAGGLPNYNYPPFAWYTDQEGLTYVNLVYEYMYFAISAYQGSLSWRTDLTNEWTPLTQTDLRLTDTIVDDVIENPIYSIPATEPVLDYWTAVTNTLGGIKRDLVFAPAEDFIITSTTAMIMPRGNNNQRPNVTGAIRFNTETEVFEGVVDGGAISLDGIYSTDRRTYLDLSNNQYQFVTDLNTNHILNGTLLESQGFSSDHKFSIDGNIVSSDEADGDIFLRSNGTGRTKIQDLDFQDSDLYNTTNDNFAFNLTNTEGRAYLKFDNVNGIVIPFGGDATRPISPEQGHLRYNTDDERVEVWNGTEWINSAGSVESILEEDVEELAFTLNIMLD